MKTFVAALAGASLIALAAPAAAEPNHHSGWGHSSDAAASSGGFRGPGGYGRSAYAAGGYGFHPRFVGFVGYPYYFADFGLGFALGLSVVDPWYYDGYYAPYGSYYAPYGPPPPPGGYYYPAPGAAYAPPASQAAPPPPSAGASQPPAAACGSWSWDQAKQTYNWVPCS